MDYNYTNPFNNWQYNPVPSYIPTQPQSNGIPMPLRVFDYVERKPTIESSKPVTDEYVTKEDLKKFMDEIKFTINERNNYHKKPQNKE